MRDWWAISASGLCLLHCVLPTLLAIIGLQFSLFQLESPILHIVLLVPIALLAMSSFPIAYRAHRHIGPSVLASTGMFALTLGLLTASETVAHGATIIGSLMLIVAHAWNRFLNREMANAQDLE